jgi:hypothetical protein
MAVESLARKLVKASTLAVHARPVEATSVYEVSTVYESIRAMAIGSQLVPSGDTSKLTAPAVMVVVAIIATLTVEKLLIATVLAVLSEVALVHEVVLVAACEPAIGNPLFASTSRSDPSDPNPVLRRWTLTPLTAPPFRVVRSSVEIVSPPLPALIVVLSAMAISP